MMQVRDAMGAEGELPSEEWIPDEDLRNHTECITLTEDEPQINNLFYSEL